MFVLAGGGPGDPGSAIGWLALLHLGLIVSGVAYGLYFSAARVLRSTHLTILTLLEPLLATLIAIAFFGEALTLGVLAGAVLMLERSPRCAAARTTRCRRLRRRRRERRAARRTSADRRRPVPARAVDPARSRVSSL